MPQEPATSGMRALLAAARPSPTSHCSGSHRPGSQRTLLIRQTPIEAAMATTAVAPNRAG